MTLQEYQQKLLELRKGVSEEVTERIVVLSANALLANIKNRIQRDGKDSNGKKMSAYSTKPTYATRNEFVRKSSFKPIGKNGFKGERLVRSKNYTAVTQKNGKEKLVRDKTYDVVKIKPKSMFLKGGYKELRDIQGMDTSVKNLTYSGDFMLSYVLGVKGNEVLIGLNNRESIKIKEGQEKRNGGAILKGTQKEIAEYKKDIVKQYTEAYLKIVNG